jgi:hypothetical protein
LLIFLVHMARCITAHVWRAQARHWYVACSLRPFWLSWTLLMTLKSKVEKQW